MFGNCGCSAGFVSCLFSMKVDCNSILLAGEAAGGGNHGNTGVLHLLQDQIKHKRESACTCVDTHNFNRGFTAISCYNRNVMI